MPTCLFLLLYAAVVVWDLTVGLVPRGRMESGTTVEESVVREAHILFVGDVMAHLPLVRAAEIDHERYDFSRHFEGVKERFAEADYVVGNLETTLSVRPPYGGYPAFATPDSYARYMHEAGFDAVTVANNHILDRGTLGVLQTLAALDNADIESVGVRVASLNEGRTEPLVVDVEGFKIALLAYTYGTNSNFNREVEVGLMDTLTMRRHIESVRQEVDYIFALVHWGDEYARRPNAEQRRMAEWMRGAGVDFVVGSHPHVVQPAELWCDDEGRVEGGVIFSLGNFISNQNSPHTDYGLAANIRIRRDGSLPDEIIITTDTIYRRRYVENGRLCYGVEYGNMAKSVNE